MCKFTHSFKGQKKKTSETTCAWVKEVWMLQNLLEAVGPHYVPFTHTHTTKGVCAQRVAQSLPSGLRAVRITIDTIENSLVSLN